jgi:hypothetical protein
MDGVLSLVAHQRDRHEAGALMDKTIREEIVKDTLECCPLAFAFSEERTWWGFAWNVYFSPEVEHDIAMLGIEFLRLKWNTTREPKVSVCEIRCPICMKAIERRPGVQPSRYKERVTCSRECAGKLRRRNTEENRQYLQPKRCEHCGGMFSQLPGQSNQSFNLKKSCSKACEKELRFRTYQASNAQSTNPDTKGLTQSRTCVVCGKDFMRRREEQSSHYQRRKVCSKECKLIIMASAGELGRNRRRGIVDDGDLAA